MILSMIAPLRFATMPEVDCVSPESSCVIIHGYCDAEHIHYAS